METTDLIPDFIGRRRWAVVGVSQDPAKYGGRIYRTLRDSGYIVYAVNPKGRGGRCAGVSLLGRPARIA